MINPNRMHRSRAVIVKLGPCSSVFRLPSGRTVEGFDIPARFTVGEAVNIQASFSIMLDSYVVKTVNKIRNRKVA